MKLLPMLCLILFFYVFIMGTSLHDANQGSELADALLKWKASFDNQSKALLSSWNIGNKHCN
jgi:uncharacterized membrane protein affecting hemolysin expression